MGGATPSPITSTQRTCKTRSLVPISNLLQPADFETLKALATQACSQIPVNTAPKYLEEVETTGLSNGMTQLQMSAEDAALTKQKHAGALIPLDAVVKVFCVHTEPNFSVPWQMKRPYNSKSSGFIISGRRLLTNAHSVHFQTQIRVQGRCSSKKFLARALAINRDCDLALLTVDDDEFWETMTSLVEIGDLPDLQEAVTLVGYPVGGNTMSVTRGVVSRIVYTSYSGASYFLAVQIDAAINCGNSGGPAFDDKGQCVGIAFQKLTTDCDNIGYLIPTSVIAHFIRDYELNGDCTEFPALGITWQTLENPDLRNALCMAAHLEGICVLEIEPTSPAAKFLQPSDIILSFDGVNIANDGTVPFLNGERINFGYLVTAKYMGEQAKFQIFRDSVIRNFDIELQTYKPLIPKYIKGRAPSYYIIGGIVFISVSVPYLCSEFDDDFCHAAPPSLINKYLHSVAHTEDEELVIVSQILDDEINIDYEDCTNCQVVSFNGKSIRNLVQLTQLVETCREPFLRFGIEEHHQMLVLDSRKAKEATPRIMKTHCIPSAISEDLLPSLTGL
ncbi:hypothetical protein GOP47_0007761 [Adiantum capillus-veneris]|uniref:Protease Do-like 9 n=1 Tax=Adiantum capillus-veneris TaxID=13818 RepID=A0A9D4V2U2_ADICA|nr:hypothetical protein GOP47_0007761 [Adiantum capillus-veneris]